MDGLKTACWLRSIGEKDLLVGETWALCRILIHTRTIFKIEHGTFIDHPATVTIYVLNIVMHDIEESESAIVVNVICGTWSNHSVPPDERSTQIVIVLLEIDQAGIVAVKIAVQLIRASACIASTAELEGPFVV